MGYYTTGGGKQINTRDMEETYLNNAYKKAVRDNDQDQIPVLEEEIEHRKESNN